MMVKGSIRVHGTRYRVQIILLIMVLLFNLTGCASLRKKFTRKKETKEKSLGYVRIQKYDIKPSLELYTKHYTYWRSWHRELLENLGDNQKKDSRCIGETIGNLEDMSDMLTDEKAEGLNKRIASLQSVEAIINKGGLTLATKTRIRKNLEHEYNLVKRDYSYKKVVPYIRRDFKPEADEN